jgi:hypothetical protein
MKKLLLAAALLLFTITAQAASVVLVWSASPTSTEYGADVTYNVYKKGTAIANVDGLTYTDGSAVIGDCYFVKASNNGLEGTASNTVCANQPGSPTLKWIWKK